MGGCGGLLLEERNAPLARLQSEKGKKIAAKKIVKKNCLAEPLWTKELEYGERRDGVVDEEVLICGLKKDKSRVA